MKDYIKGSGTQNFPLSFPKDKTNVLNYSLLVINSKIYSITYLWIYDAFSFKWQFHTNLFNHKHNSLEACNTTVNMEIKPLSNNFCRFSPTSGTFQ